MDKSDEILQAIKDLKDEVKAWKLTKMGQHEQIMKVLKDIAKNTAPLTIPADEAEKAFGGRLG